MESVANIREKVDTVTSCTEGNNDENLPFVSGISPVLPVSRALSPSSPFITHLGWCIVTREGGKRTTVVSISLSSPVHWHPLPPLSLSCHQRSSFRPCFPSVLSAPSSCSPSCYEMSCETWQMRRDCILRDGHRLQGWHPLLTAPPLTHRDNASDLCSRL